MSLLTSAATVMRMDDARLPELIRDEIKARTFFVLCNTRASRRSKWVKQEIELVKRVTKRANALLNPASAIAFLGTSPPEMTLVGRSA